MSKEADQFNWGEIQFRPVDLLDGTSVRAVSNGKALSVLFDTFTFNMPKPDGGLTATKICALSFPVTISGGKKSVWYREALRGFVQKDADARVILIADIGGELHTEEFPYGKKTKRDLTLEYKHKSKATPSGIYTVTLLLAVERRTADSLALAAIDSLDIEASITKPET